VAKQFTLGKQERLKSRKTIEQLFTEGKKFMLSPFRIFYLFDPMKNSPLQFGVGVSTKNFKKAIDRNKIKRIIREAYRLQKLPLQKKLKEKNLHLNLFFIYTAKELTDYKVIYDKMDLVLQKLMIEVEKQSEK
jgi:ribonuclease P protein component